MSWEAHRESVTFAKAGLVDLMEALEIALAKQETAMGLVAEAVGRPAAIPSGSTAFEHTAKVGADLMNSLHSCRAARNALNEYFNSF